jgi:hypothetical protein
LEANTVGVGGGKTGPRKPARISSLILFCFGLGGWLGIHGRGGVSGYIEGLEGLEGKEKETDRRKVSKQARNGIEDKREKGAAAAAAFIITPRSSR